MADLELPTERGPGDAVCAVNTQMTPAIDYAGGVLNEVLIGAPNSSGDAKAGIMVEL
jgi:hypothetical protein